MSGPKPAPEKQMSASAKIARGVGGTLSEVLKNFLSYTVQSLSNVGDGKFDPEKDGTMTDNNNMANNMDLLGSGMNDVKASVKKSGGIGNAISNLMSGGSKHDSSGPAPM
jgi:hypothetical protein